MSKRPHGKAPVSDEPIASPSEKRIHSHAEKHVHLTNCIHIKGHLHLQSHEGLMLDARRASSLQLPRLKREVTALHKIRTLQDPGTSSCSSSDNNKSRVQSTTLSGDPHGDAIELSRKLANSAEVSSNGGSRRKGPEKSKNVGRVVKKKRTTTKMTAEDIPPSNNGVNVRERIKRIEEAFDGSTTNTLSGELRKEDLIKELKEREKVSALDIPRSDERWEEGPARREELARRVIEERGSSISSLSQLLGNHYGSGRSAAIIASMVDDEEGRSNRGESIFESDEEDLSPTDRGSQSGRVAPMSPASPLHLASLSLVREKPVRNISLSTRKPKPRRGTAVNVARPGRSTQPKQVIADDELDVSELPNGCGLQWDPSRIHRYGGKSFLDLTGVTCSQLPDVARQHGLEALMVEQKQNRVQSISSLDSDANALPLIIGEDAHDSDLAGYYNERVPQKLGKRKVPLQNAVKGVPASTSRLNEGISPEREHRTLTHKYRPKKFRDIVGQAVVVKSLSTAVMRGKVAPIYLFMGPCGTGKTSAARVFAAGLNCESPDYASRPCGICRECATMALNRSAAVKQIDAASTADLAGIRPLIMESFTPPHVRYKVFIVERCDLLTTDTWNAFLKVLEEPPRNVVFILITTNPEQIPAMAASRCQKFPFLKVGDDDIVRRLQLLATKEGLVFEDGAMELIAARSDGSLRDAEIVLDQLCLLDKNVSVALVQELVGLPSNSKIMDLLDYALSADTVNTVRTMREVLASAVEPMSLVSQLGALITDILVGSRDVNRETRPSTSFFNRNYSMKEEHHRLRQALKILSEAEKQLRVTSDRATWLTAALLQFAPDRSFLPSPKSSMEPTPLVPLNTGPVANSSLPRSEHPSMNEPEYQTQVPEYQMQVASDTPEVPEHPIQAPDPSKPGLPLQAYTESNRDHSPEAQDAATLTEQKLEEAWAREQPQQQQGSVQHVGETSEVGRAPEEYMEFQVFKDEILPELWKRVLCEITSRSLKHLLETHGRLVAVGVAVDGSCLVVELEFKHARDKHRAERKWRSICIAFQEVLRTAVELRIAFSDITPEEQATMQTSKNTETVEDDRLGPSTSQIMNEEDAFFDAPPQRRGAKPRKHRKASKASESDRRAGSGGITPRRLPPSRRRRPKRAANSNPDKPTKTVIAVREIRHASQESSSFGGGELWESGPQLIPAALPNRPAPSGTKNLLSTMMEDPLSEIEDYQSARRKISQQNKHFQHVDGSISSAFGRRTSMVDNQRGIPREIRLCWHKASPQPEFLMRKSRVKGLRRTRGKALILRLVPCSASKINKNVTPVPQGTQTPTPPISTRTTS